MSNSAVVADYRGRERVLRRRFGYDVHLASPPAFEEGGRQVVASQDVDVPTHIVRIRGRTSHPNLFWYATRELRQVLREVRPDIVDLHAEPYSLATAVALDAVKREVKSARVCLYTAQNILKRHPWPFSQLEQRALRTAAAAYPCSTEAAEVLKAKGFRGDIHVLPLGVTVRPRPRRDFARTGLHVGFVGRLEPYKGAGLAIRAFALATGDLDAQMEIVGSGSEQSELRAFAATLGIASRVSFVGAVSQDEALARIAGYDVIMVPSVTTANWKEQFGRVAVQALEAGTPVIVSESGSLPEVVNGCGELVREGDIEGLARALRALLMDPARRAEMSARGRQRARECFSWEVVAAGCDRMYRQMLEDG